MLSVKISNETSVPSAFLIVHLAAACGTNVCELSSSRLALDMEGVGGGDVKPRLFEECERVEGRGDEWTGEAIV